MVLRNGTELFWPGGKYAHTGCGEALSQICRGQLRLRDAKIDDICFDAVRIDGKAWYTVQSFRQLCGIAADLHRA